MTEPAMPMSEEVAEKEAARLIHAAYQPTSFRDDSPIPVVGSAPPVPQPGRPPMSQGATDASVLMLAGGASTAMVGGTAAVVMYYSQFANPVVCAIVFGAPTALVLALARLAGKAKAALPEEHHHHYAGPVYQDQRNTENRSVWAKTINRK
ncbi:predicted protein [Streptomyces viridosporus ATCC 14672]|uniref:Predicted protein n=1 Tax=Streptomyces viridosporus (strain ATCC 14672 / DSM 40746 / JCM 4963 / KCTC 9882 / NRRL B-12104 / FH 1290) TaxID=566461 RepID=D6A4F3_STRV1|nr:hypothetical protein [Streptomyces viridosporus]EFE65793.1 predicted protein [Streptomyces viridosporus ATCC 14672]